MAKSTDTGGAPFDLEKLRELIEMMETHGLSEINLRRGEERWQLRRGPQEVVHAAPQPIPVAAPPAQTPQESPAPAAKESDGGIVIKSPTIGTFYSAPSPDDPPFVTVGSKVDADTVVCLVEAMKVFNQIPAGVSGTITKILVNNGDAVEFDTPLFQVSPG